MSVLQHLQPDSRNACFNSLMVWPMRGSPRTAGEKPQGTGLTLSIFQDVRAPSPGNRSSPHPEMEPVVCRWKKRKALHPHWIPALLHRSIPSMTKVVNKYSWINYCNLRGSLPLSQPLIHIAYGMWILPAKLIQWIWFPIKSYKTLHTFYFSYLQVCFL